MHTSPVSRRKAPGYPVLETYKFIPYLSAPTMTMSDAVRCSTQIILENTPMLKVKAVEVDSDNKTIPIISLFETALGDLPLVTSDLMLLTAQDLKLGKIHIEDGKLSTQTNCLIIISSNCIERKLFVESALKCFSDRGGYLVSRESKDFNLKTDLEKCPSELQVVSVIPTVEGEILVLLQQAKNQKDVAGLATVVNITSKDSTISDSYEWLEELKTAVKDTKNVIVVCEKNPKSGIVGLVNCMRKEPDGTKVSCVFVDDNKAPVFSLEAPLYQDQLQLGLAINVYRNVSKYS